MPFGLISDIFGGGDDVEQNTTVDIVNENTFSPNLIVDVAIGGLEALGGAVREIASVVTRQNQSQTQSIDQAGLNVSSAIDIAGVNISNSLVNASENIESSVVGLGVNVGFALVAGATVLTLGRALRRG